MFKISKKGYKIVREAIDGSYFSCITNSSPVTYGINKWAEPPKNCGSLAVFNTYEDALDFKKNYYMHYEEMHVFECKYKESKKKYLENLRGKSGFSMLPVGTKFADKVKLIKEKNHDNKNNKKSI